MPEFLKQRRLLRLSILLLVAACIAAASYASRHQIKELIRLYRLYRANGSLWNARTARCLPDRSFRIPRDDGLSVPASLYGTGRSDARAAILLLHGNTPDGRQLPFYRVLSRRLADRGFLVMAIDLLGFGESDDPLAPGREVAWNGDKDVRTALAYLESLVKADHRPIYIMAHSGGTSSALAVGIDDPRVSGIIMIGPPRRSRERSLDAQDNDYWWERAKRTYRTVYGTDFPSWYTREQYEKRPGGPDLEDEAVRSLQPGHKPLLFIDGGLESEADRKFLQAYCRSIAPPKEYATIPGSNHYANTVGTKRLVLYDQKAVGSHVNEITRWIASQKK